MRIIEITRGEKPEPTSFKFGVTTEHDYYVTSKFNKEYNRYRGSKESVFSDFLQQVKKIVKKKDFKYSAEFIKFNNDNFFPKLKD